MSIAVFDKFVNGIPTAVFDGKDVSMVLLVDPPAELPPFFLANKGVLDTASKTIKVYDETGNTVIHDFDIAGTDLTPINEAIAGLESRVDTNETDIGTLQSDVSTNTTNIGTNASDIGDLQGRATDLESTTSKHTTDIQGLQSATGTNASDISALTLRVGKNETDIAAVVITANAADTLSKQNKERLDNLPEPPSLEGYIKTGDDATLNSVSFGDNTKIDTQPDLGLVLQGDYIYGKADSGYEHFFVESGNFNVKSKKIQKVNDGQAEDDAVNLRQLGVVEGKADAAQTTANAADTLSKANKERLDGLPADVTPRVEALETNALQKDANGYDAKSLKILNVASGEDTDTSVANIGDVKRISTEGSGLKPTENEWDMLTYPITNIGASDIETSAATVGQVNAVDSKADTNAGAISNLSTTVGQHDTQIGTNTSNIVTVTSTANAADALSKDNKTRLDNLPPSPDLSGYVKNGDDVNFGTADINIVKVTKGNDPTKFSDILIDGNTNTQMNFVGDTHFYIRNKSDNSKGLEALQIDSSARLVAKQKIKTPIITNLTTGTTNSNTDKAGFIDLTQDNETKLGAKNSVLFDVGGNLSAGVYSDHVNFNTDYVTGVKMRDVGSRQPYDAINWETLQSFTPSLDGYAKLGTAVNFADVTIDANGTLQSPTTLKVRIDGNETISFAKSAIYPKNNIVMGSKQITGLANGGGADHAVNKGQLDTVSNRISDVRSTTTWTHFTFNGNTLQDYFNGIGATNEEKKANFLEACAKAVDTRKGNSTSWEAVKIISGASPDWDTGSEIFPRYGTWVFRRKGNTARNELTWFNEHQTKRLYGSISTTGVFGGWIQAANQFTNASFEDITASNLTLSSDESLIKGNSTGTLVIQNADSIRRNHTNDSNSVSLKVGNNVYKSDIHHFRNNDDEEQLRIQNDSVSVKNKRITEVDDGTAITDAVNMRLARIGLQSNVVNVGGLDLLSESGQTLEYWMNNTDRSQAHTFYNRIRKARPTSTLGGASHNNWVCHYAFDQNSAIWNFLPSSITPASGHMQILHEADLKARWIIWIADKILLSKSLTFNIGTGASGQPDTAFGIFDADGGGNNPAELDGFKKFYQISTNTTYYSHNGDNHLYIDWSGNGGEISLDTMRNGSDQQEDMVMVHNKSDYNVGVRCFFNGSSTLYQVPPKSFIQAWANREIGRWVAGLYKDPNFVPEITVVKADDIEWTTSSDPRTNTQRLIAAAPAMCTIIGRHVKNGSAKQNIISVGDTNRIESQTSNYVIHKHSSGHATGMCTSEETSGKTWSRILDSRRNAWFTNESANSRMVSGDIDPTQYPEDQLFFTTDQGIMETYFDEEEDLVKLRVLEGYNVPKHDSDIAALEVQTEKNRSQTHYFINEGSLSYDWPDEARRPLVEVQVLNTMQTINNSSVTVTDNDTHRYSGTYNSVGAVAINSSGNWSVQYVYHNAYKKTDQDWYVVFNQGNASWQIIEAANPHTSVGSTAASVTVQLGGQTSLPESFGNYTIDPNFDNIDSLEFLSAEVPVQYDDINSRVLINFNGAKPSGYVVLK